MKYVNYKTINKSTGDLKKSSELYINNSQSIQGGFMNEQQQMEERLWDFIDGIAGEPEKSAIEQLIATNTEWKNKFKELMAVHQLMESSDLDEPSLRFTKNVMENIARFHVAPATRSYINKRIIWGIFGFFMLMILGFIVYGFAQLNLSNQGSTDILSQYNFSKRIDFGKIFTSTYTNIFMLINVILGLVLMDMYLQRKKESFSQKKA
jgi:hypothetical protein